MTYKDHFVAEVKCGGKILRITDGAVRLPFGAEYSLLFKNLNSRRVAIKVSIDGQDALDNHRLILDPNETTELKGFMQYNVVRNAFKYIQKTKQIQEHRGDKIDDGMIRIEFAFEKPVPEHIMKTVIHEVHHYPHRPSYPYYWYDAPNWVYTSNDIYGSAGTARGLDSVKGIDTNSSIKGMTGGVTGQMVGEVQSVYNCSVPLQELSIKSEPAKDEGITVKGSELYQALNYTSIGELEQAEVIIIQLKGSGDTGVMVEKPVTVHTRLVCKTCGVSSPSNNKYCPSCGTYLLS
jgi:hypothetical protein